MTTKAEHTAISDDDIWRSSRLLMSSTVDHGTASRAFGSLSIRRGVTPEAVWNRQRLAANAGFDLGSITMVKQTHSSLVHVVSEEDVGNAVSSSQEELPDGDAMVSNIVASTLVVKTNDCVPIVMYDSVRKVIAAAHAGWRGVAGNIAARTLEKMATAHSSRPSDVEVVLGPSIRGCHYDNTDSSDGRMALLEAAFPSGDGVIITRRGRTFVDLANGVVLQLIECGIDAARIDVCPDCTFETHSRWPSRRANGNKPTGLSTWTFISLRPRVQTAHNHGLNMDVTRCARNAS